MVTQEQITFYKTIDYIANTHHETPLENFSGKAIPVNLFLMGISQILGKKQIIMGEPGFGKTTGAKIISSLFSRIPYDILDSCTIEGHPEVTQEKIVGRPHLGKLLKEGQEHVVWKAGLYLPTIIVDEFNRLPPSKQTLLLQGLDTGTWNYLDCTLRTGKKSVFLTMNHADNGNNTVLPPMLDRFHIVTEEQWHSSFGTLTALAMEGSKSQLECPQLTNEFFQQIQTGRADMEKLVGTIQRSYENQLTQRKIPFLSDTVITALRDGIKKQQVNVKANPALGIRAYEDTNLFWQCIDAEFNLSNQCGTRRRSDLVSTDSHDKAYASTQVKNALSKRAMRESIYDYSKAFSYLIGEPHVSIATMKFIASYCLAHRLEFTPDCVSEYKGKTRTKMESLYIAEQLLEGIFERYTKSIEPIKGEIAKIRNKDKDAIEKMKKDSTTFGDHPLLVDLKRAAKEPENPFYQQYLGQR